MYACIDTHEDLLTHTHTQFKATADVGVGGGVCVGVGGGVGVGGRMGVGGWA